MASLARRDGLLLLDNCEHLLDGVRECVDLVVAGCPGVTVLATSRTRLMLPYERVYPVPGLSVTEDDGGDAVALFAARAVEATGEATRRTSAARRPCAGAWTAWRWPSSWPRPATRRWGWTGWRPACTSGCDSSPSAATRPTGTARCATRSAGATTCSLPPTRRCCAASPSSRPGSTSPPPARSPLLPATTRRSPTGCPAWPTTACSSSTAASRHATDYWRRSDSTARSGSTRQASWPPFRAGTRHGAAPSSSISRPHRPTRRGAPGSTRSSTMPGPRCSGAPPTPTAADRPQNSRPS